MDELQRSVRQQLLECRRDLEALEAASSNRALDPVASVAVQHRFRTNLHALARNVGSMRSLLSREPAARREIWRVRVSDLGDQIAELQAADARLAARFQDIATEVSVREELFQRRNYNTSRGDTIIKVGLDAGHDSPADAHSAALSAAGEHRSLMSSQNGASGILNTGATALELLVNQRVRLKGARRKVMDVMNTMDAGRRIIARIERRDRRDTLLMYSLMLGILVLLGLAVLYKRSGRST